MPRPSSSLALVILGAYVMGMPVFALDARRTLTQYTRTVWNQADGLPQDTIRRITQTSDGYLWLGTEEGLTRFDGYDFVTFTRNNSSLPGNSITWLTAGEDGTLWIGTSAGLVRYREGQFKTYTTKDGLPDNVITTLFMDHAGTLWIAAGIHLVSFADGKFKNFPSEALLPLQTVRAVFQDRRNTLWIARESGVLRFDGKTFIPVLGPKELDGNTPITLRGDRDNTLWIGGTKGLMSRTVDGRLRKFDKGNGLPDNLVRTLLIDRAGNVWAGTKEYLSRLEGDHFVSTGLGGNNHEDLVRSLFEDREGNLWIGMTSGLNRLRDGRFTMYGRAEGLPSDEPRSVRQDRKGQIWVGYHGAGLVKMQEGASRIYTMRDGLPSNEIFAIREDRNGELLLSTSRGLSWMHKDGFANYVLPDPLKRASVYDAIEDDHGQIWAGGPGGVYRLTGHTFQNVIPGGSLLGDSVVVLSRGSGVSVWAGTYGKGLWRIENDKTRQFTTADGLGSDQIRSLYMDGDGTLWIGTFGGGLNILCKGTFSRFTTENGLSSDNVSHIEDDGAGSLWLSTTRGIDRFDKQQLLDFAGGRIKVLTPTSYGTQDGLRSAQSLAGYQVGGGGGTRTQDGRIWFTTSRGLAVINPKVDASEYAPPAPIIQFLDVSADGQKLDLRRAVRLSPGTGHIQLRYAGIYLTAPERVSYAYKLVGLDRDWIPAGARRTVDYNGLRHGEYRFLVRATVSGRPSSSDSSFSLEVLPHFYEERYFLLLCVILCLAATYGLYQVHVRQIRVRFALVLEERARMAREIHDTLAQGFVGISRQLDAIAMRMSGPDRIAQQHLELAQKMARHSLTEARRSVMDLRAHDLQDRDLGVALIAAAHEWTEPGAVPFEIDVSGETRKLPEDVEHNVFRIAQEAVANAHKHASATKISIHLRIDLDHLLLTVKDNGRGFEPSGALSSTGGHFGLLGMRERAEQLGGELDLASQPGVGSEVRVSIPLSSETLQSATRLRRLVGVVRGG